MIKITKSRLRKLIRKSITEGPDPSLNIDQHRARRFQEVLDMIQEMGFDLGYSTWSDSNAIAVDDAKAAYPGEFTDEDVNAAVDWYYLSGAARIRESYGDQIGSGDPTQEILNWAEEGNRVTVAGKNIWPGLGNRSGLHSYADELIFDKWKKSGDRFAKKIDNLPAGTKVELKRFKNMNRDRGKWVTAVTVTTTGPMPNAAGSSPSRKTMQDIYTILGIMYDRDIGKSHLKSISTYSDHDEPFNGINWEIIMKDGSRFIFPDGNNSRGEYAEWEDKHGEGFWETYMAY
ncbi:MAG: hypothetical protein CME70_19525 [Halobacteriovorax sp.]|nr:hypothetical protein [Halobacteriovorax sp.]MBK26198.1 hypothetical protein [Halobacteriovorax sp.]|tara:strand:- start:7318 stop:8181 length:864 start_codon:yes stop_codon:yes gene_type:complete